MNRKDQWTLLDPNNKIPWKRPHPSTCLVCTKTPQPCEKQLMFAKWLTSEKGRLFDRFDDQRVMLLAADVQVICSWPF